MKTIKEVITMANVSRQTVYKRIEAIEDVTGMKIKREYQEGKSNPDRIVSDDIARMIVNWKGKKPGRKPLGKSSLSEITKEEIEEVLG